MMSGFGANEMQERNMVCAFPCAKAEVDEEREELR
jgi:hypothetical protein